MVGAWQITRRVNDRRRELANGTVQLAVDLDACGFGPIVIRLKLIPSGEVDMMDALDDSRTNPARSKLSVTDKGGSHQIERSTTGEFMVFWNGQAVYENGRIKKFQTGSEARDFLARCDAAGKIIH